MPVPSEASATAPAAWRDPATGRARSGWRRWLPIGAVITLILAGAVGMLLFLGVNFGGVALLVGIIAAVIPVPLLVAAFLWLDRYEPEPGRYRLAALGWGAVIAVGISLVLEMVIPSSPNIGTAVVAPFVEEFAKGLFVVAIVVLRREQLHGVLDGIGIAVMSRSRVVRIVAPILGYLSAVLLHGIWNGTAVWGGETTFFLVYGVFYLPLIVAAVVVLVWIRRREGRMLTTALDQSAQLGLISRAEIGWVATMKSRVAARRYARQVGGKPAERVLEDYQQTLTEIGFLHDRVLKGVAPANFRVRMAELEQHLATIRPYVVLPLTIGPGPQSPGPADTHYSPIPGGGSQLR